MGFKSSKVRFTLSRLCKGPLWVAERAGPEPPCGLASHSTTFNLATFFLLDNLPVICIL